MSRMDREVSIDVAQDTDVTSQGWTKWYAEVIGRGNKVIHTTDYYLYKNEALVSAMRWVSENGHVTIAF